MVIEQILKKLTPERVKKEVEAIQGVKFPPDMRKWFKEFDKVGERPVFLWKWLYKINKIWIYSPIQKKHSTSLRKVKTLYNMFIVLLDDIAETTKRKRLLDELLKIPFEKKYIDSTRLSPEDKQYLKFTIKVWLHINKIIKKFPHYKAIREPFEYDTAQFLNAVRYAYLIYRNPYYINSHEYWLYIPHSMQILINLNLDLMCSMKLDIEDVGRARKTILCLQEMGRIGNWLVTWEREIKVNDFTSIVIAYALEQGITTFRDLQNEDKDKLIEKIKNSAIEKFLLKKEWENRYKTLIERSKASKLINAKKILKLPRYLIFMHLMSRGLR
jgi:hypothetical protein